MLTAKKLKQIRELAEKSRARHRDGLYIVEGPRTCELLDADAAAEVYVTETFLSGPLSGRCSHLLGQAQIVSESEMKKCSDTATPQGILCLVKLPAPRRLEELLEEKDGRRSLLLILETIQDPGNLGTILRAAEAAGCSGILMNETTVDPYSPKVVRSSMGSLFRIPLRITKDLCGEVRCLREEKSDGGKNIRLFATSPAAETDYCKADFKGSCGVMIGNEASGLTEELIKEADELLTIPMEGKIESLNAAMAATIIVFEAARQRRF